MKTRFAGDGAVRSGSVSRRGALIGGTAILAAALGARHPVFGQEVTPAAAEIVVEALGAGFPAATPGRQLILARATFPVGAILHTHTHPGPVVAYVESGTYGYTPVAGEASFVTRAAAPDSPEAVPLGAEITLAPGDALFHDEPVAGIDRAVGDEPLVLLLAVLFDPTQPLYHLVEGTPTP
jgi:hypothetical protein